MTCIIPLSIFVFIIKPFAIYYCFYKVFSKFHINIFKGCTSICSSSFFSYLGQRTIRFFFEQNHLITFCPIASRDVMASLIQTAQVRVQSWCLWFCNEVNRTFILRTICKATYIGIGMHTWLFTNFFRYLFRCDRRSACIVSKALTVLLSKFIRTFFAFWISIGIAIFIFVLSIISDIERIKCVNISRSITFFRISQNTFNFRISSIKRTLWSSLIIDTIMLLTEGPVITWS